MSKQKKAISEQTPQVRAIEVNRHAENAPKRGLLSHYHCDAQGSRRTLLSRGDKNLGSDAEPSHLTFVIEFPPLSMDEVLQFDGAAPTDDPRIEPPQGRPDLRNRMRHWRHTQCPADNAHFASRHQ